jgi:hypothetical protein
MNYSTIQSHVARNVGNRATDAGITTLIQELINLTYLDLVTMAKFPELSRFEPIPVPVLDTGTTISTSSTVPNYTVPSDMMFPISLRDTTNGNPLKQRDIRWYDRFRSPTNEKPRFYINYGGYFYLEPCPNGTYSIYVRYRKKVDAIALVNPGDVPIIGAEWHEALELGATYRVLRSLGDPKATQYSTDLKNFMISHSEQHTEEEEDYNGGFRVKL